MIKSENRAHFDRAKVDELGQPPSGSAARAEARGADRHRRPRDASRREFAGLVRHADLGVIVDVRRFPGSRHNPQFGRDEMERWLPSEGLAYWWLPALGGRRKGSPGSPNAALRNAQFRAYADHMSSDEFGAAVAELLALASTVPVAVMCSEAVWWRCHRRLLADHIVLVAGVRVTHLFHDARLADHPVTPGARRSDRHVVYDSVSG